MKEFLKKYLGSVDRPVIPIWIFLVGFIASIAMSAVSMNAGMYTSIAGIGLFLLATLYNVVLLIIGKKRKK